MTAATALARALSAASVPCTHLAQRETRRSRVSAQGNCPATNATTACDSQPRTASTLHVGNYPLCLSSVAAAVAAISMEAAMAAMARSHRGGPVPPAARPGGDPSRSRRCPIRDGRRVQQYDDTNKKTREQQSRREVVHARRSLCNRGAAQNREPHAGGSGRADTAAATVKFQSLYSPSSSAAAAPYAIATGSVRPHRHSQPIPLAKGGTAAVAAAASATAAAAAAAGAAAAARSARTVTDTPPRPLPLRGELYKLDRVSSLWLH